MSTGKERERETDACRKGIEKERLYALYPFHQLPPSIISLPCVRPINLQLLPYRFTYSLNLTLEVGIYSKDNKQLLNKFIYFLQSSHQLIKRMKNRLFLFLIKNK